ncbi:divergent polysaccharide deacetylase family protein [Salipaludibacillus sp. CUR1]|uniref:divergent polysaccharide deacetylase family protein n=1 Tax=Salipaludibacillus sp. CUR1 TaxID=2820003 RepID=UPI001E63EBD4|nr:divergent polysaccharide deacetylase family protein [Salipaludibacillus sp. CUR1]MCE7794382.1 divergent polysaccharide deacetylase family protein [Salipaludibacillus sp. CUR1]
MTAKPLKVFWVCVLFFLFLTESVVEANDDWPVGKAAIIIDDFGGTGKGTEEFLAGNIPVTVAIMPFMEHSTEIAERANELGFEVIIHLPMEPKKGKVSWLGPNPILSNLTAEEVHDRVKAAIEDVPHAKGINQHMGSKIVENKEIINEILSVAKAHDFYVIDSGTNPKSCLPSVSKKYGLLFDERDIFLDNTHSSSNHVYKMAKKLADLAEANGEAIGIGHVGIKGKETYMGIQKAVPYFEENNVTIVPASSLLETEIDEDFDGFWQD